MLALSPFAIEALDDPPARRVLRQALATDTVVYTSPNAVAGAASLQALKPRRGQRVLAVGNGTRRALLRHGIDAVAPSRMDSEGLLALAQLGHVAGRRIGLVTGAGGRNLLAPALRERDAEVIRADVYRRVPLPLPSQSVARLRDALTDPGHVVLAMSSGEALQQVLAALPGSLRARFARVAVVAASARLARTARDAGFRRITVATDATPAALLRAAVETFV